jgi:hypothetical protein
MKIFEVQFPLSNEQTQNWKIRLPRSSAFKKVVQRLRESFIGSNELRIWQSCDRFGNTWWHVYDPVTGKHSSVASEEELRIWIEKRYYN